MINEQKQTVLDFSRDAISKLTEELNAELIKIKTVDSVTQKNNILVNCDKIITGISKEISKLKNLQ